MWCVAMLMVAWDGGGGDGGCEGSGGEVRWRCRGWWGNVGGGVVMMAAAMAGVGWPDFGDGAGEIIRERVSGKTEKLPGMSFYIKLH
ncbi:hypothetical protein Tco_0018150 [Tanacetum coccineum]